MQNGKGLTFNLRDQNKKNLFVPQLMEDIAAQFKCTTPWMLEASRYVKQQTYLCKAISSFLIICRKQNLSLNICGPNKSQDVSEMFKNNRYNFYPECQYPCENMEVSTMFLFKSRGYHGLKFTFIKSVPVTQESFKVSFHILLGEIGGFVGMILGKYK